MLFCPCTCFSMFKACMICCNAGSDQHVAPTNAQVGDDEMVGELEDSRLRLPRLSLTPTRMVPRLFEMEPENRILRRCLSTLQQMLPLQMQSLPEHAWSTSH